MFKEVQEVHEVALNWPCQSKRFEPPKRSGGSTQTSRPRRSLSLAIVPSMAVGESGSCGNSAKAFMRSFKQVWWVVLNL